MPDLWLLLINGLENPDRSGCSLSLQWVFDVEGDEHSKNFAPLRLCESIPFRNRCSRKDAKAQRRVRKELKVDCSLPGTLLFQDALRLEPFAKSFDPIIWRKILFAHAKSMSAFGINMDLGNMFWRDPITIHLNAVWLYRNKLIVGCCNSKHWRSIHRHFSFGKPTDKWIYRRNKIRAAFYRMRICDARR